MLDGSDAIADWPILNALVNVAAGATWVSVHHGGGVGIGNSIHAGMVVVADGTDEMARAPRAGPDHGPGDGRPAPRRRRLRRCARGCRRAERSHPDAQRRHARRRRGVTAAPAADRLLIRDLAQLATPAGADAPLRGADLGRVDVVEDAYVLCEGGAIAAVGRMRDLAPLDGEVMEIDGRGRCAIPGLVDCHTHACFGGDRVEEFALRARGASYEELHAAGGGILSTVGATRAAGEEGLRDAVRRHLDWMRRAGTTTAEAKSGYGLDRETELASLRAIRAEGAVPDVPRRPCRSAGVRRRRRVRRLPDRGGASARRRRLAEAADVFLERGAFDAAQARRYLRACAGGGSRAPAARRPVHGERSHPARDRARRPLRRPPRGDGRRRRPRPRRERGRRRAAAGERALPRPADAARAGADRRRRRRRARHGLQSRKRLLREPAPRLLPRGDAAQDERRRGARGLHGQRGARARPRRPQGAASPPGFDADIVLLDAPDWRYLAYHLGGQVVAETFVGGRRA